MMMAQNTRDVYNRPRPNGNSESGVWETRIGERKSGLREGRAELAADFRRYTQIKTFGPRIHANGREFRSEQRRNDETKYPMSPLLHPIARKSKSRTTGTPVPGLVAISTVSHRFRTPPQNAQKRRIFGDPGAGLTLFCPLRGLVTDDSHILEFLIEQYWGARFQG